jgi:drug/metabolite transporter (DMT)-like permease
VSVARDLPSVVSSLGFLGIPALGLILSTTLLGEPLTWSLALGSALIGCGVALAILARPKSMPKGI